MSSEQKNEGLAVETQPEEVVPVVAAEAPPVDCATDHPTTLPQEEEPGNAEPNAADSESNQGVEDEGEPIHEPGEYDVLSGRGASINGHKGNVKFRVLCFNRKAEFEAGNHAAKRRIATEIVDATKALNGRFLKKKQDKGPWFEQSFERAILKACQVMRDFQRPDRVALREMAAAGGARKRQRSYESTPGVILPDPSVMIEPIIENPYGVHNHDVLSGRGAFVNGHLGNARLRQLAQERKPQFDAGNFAEKRALATEIVGIIRALDPPGRFLKRVIAKKDADGSVDDDKSDGLIRGVEGDWEELSDDRAIHKACQVMRDLQRPDRVGEKKGRKRKGKEDDEDEKEGAEAEGDVKALDASGREETTTANESVNEAMIATEAVLDKALSDSDKPFAEEIKDVSADVEMMQV